MSLLMKALEKAAKDRGDPRATEPAAAPAATAASSELSLEPLAADSPAAPRPDTEGRGLASARAPATGGASRDPSQAAAMMQASSRPVGAGAYVRSHPLVAIGALAGLFAVGFGIYFFRQIASPGVSVAQTPLAKGPMPIAQTPAAPTPAASAPAAATPPPPAAVPLPREKAAAPAPAARRKPAPVVEADPIQLPSNAIAVSRGGQAPVLNPLLAEAYEAFQANQIEQAQRLYTRLFQTEPKNIDALLGLAAIAVLGGRNDEATAHYLRILELDPRQALAQSGLIGLLGRADPGAAESKLKQLIAREPTAHLYFTLGNLYADQSQWAAAQHAYFQAHHLDTANPDYAYNLAVGLEHVGQHKLALGYYRRAVQLTTAKSRASFSLAQAQERISRLAAQVE